MSTDVGVEKDADVDTEGKRDPTSPPGSISDSQHSSYPAPVLFAACTKPLPNPLPFLWGYLFYVGHV